MPAPPPLSEACQRWAQAANYSLITSDSGEMMLRSAAAHQSRYFIRRRGADRLELTESDPETGGERPLLFVADVAVLERHLLAVMADEIRDDGGLPFLELPTSRRWLAPGYSLGEMSGGYRTLSRVDAGPVAAAPDAILSVAALVPLSQFLRWSVSDLTSAFLDEGGAPLLDAGGYATPRAKGTAR
ncbi:Imm61 family immunity protein [Mycolicibacterium frederiksbergense]|uniref:Imm61 family immunity protein n=1 Tax=Mycolicibacterium frederiksbergense TaxID=117567 RepID=UPI001F1EAC8E|nr:Imm61 family immunity protein [Mycolicibacterium frederiksbergense]